MGREEFVQGLRPKGMGRIPYSYERERDLCLFVRESGEMVMGQFY
jgi:hypothetical protein